MVSAEDQVSDVGKGDEGNQVVPFKPGAKTIGQGYKTWDHKRLSAPPFNFSWMQPQKGQPAPPPIGKDDPVFAKWKPRQGMPKGRKFFCRQDGLDSDCLECIGHSVFGRKPGKGHNSKGVLIVNGMPMPACPKTRFGRKRIKSKRKHLTGEDPEGWKTSWFPVMSDPALTCTTACEKSPKKRQKRQNEPSVPKPAPKPAPQQPLQPLNVEPTVEQQVQQSYGASAPEPASEPVYLPASVPPLQQSQANLVAFQEPVDVPGNVSLPCDNAEQLDESDADSSASEMTKWARDNNVDNFEEALLDFETPAEPPTEPPTEAATEQPTDQPPIQPTQPGLLPVTSANAEMSPSTGANGDLTHMGLGNNDQATLTPAEQEAVLTLVNDFFMQ